MQPITSFQEFEAFLARFTNYERVQFLRYDKKTLGLARMRSFVEEVGSPHLACPSVHIAGTKGKGSTSLILEALLQAAGMTVGTYTSPHVEHLRERIRLVGEPVHEEILIRELEGFMPALSRRKPLGEQHFPSFFELMTALAMACFRSVPMDWGIYEVGLGGRLDATNVLRPSWTAITSIGLEHTQQLGRTLDLIAREKAGIIKPGTPVVVGPLPPPAIAEVRRAAAEREAPVIDVDPSTVTPAGPGRICVDGVGETLTAGAVSGPALRFDLAIALVIFRRILHAAGRDEPRDAVREALARLSLPARVERIQPGGGFPPAIVDGAHTAESVEALRLTLEEIGFPRPRTLIFSIASGKEIASILPQLPRIAEDILWTRADPVRSVAPGDLRNALRAGEVIDPPEAALETALRRGRPIVITGSFYLAGRLRPRLRSPGSSSSSRQVR